MLKRIKLFSKNINNFNKKIWFLKTFFIFLQCKRREAKTTEFGRTHIL